jgi:hypothetical protein
MIILLIFAMSIIPFFIAWYLAKNPGKVTLGTNNGDLISPPETTDPGDFVGFDSFSAENLKELRGHWVLINLMPQGKCLQSCQDALFKTRQLSLMMGKDIARIRRLAVLPSNSEQQPFTKEWQDDARLLKVVPSAPLQAKINTITGSLKEGVLLIMDPLGNLMMKYSADYDPYKVRNDLSKLLRISQIG